MKFLTGCAWDRQHRIPMRYIHTGAVQRPYVCTEKLRVLRLTYGRLAETYRCGWTWRLVLLFLMAL